MTVNAASSVEVIKIEQGFSCTSDEVEIAQGITVKMYREWVIQQNREQISDFIKHRFEERYLKPVCGSPFRNGFTMVAIGCLMIETMEAFWQGIVNTKNKSRKMFEAFFSRVPQFSIFFPCADEFYYEVRCGLLHQAESRGGWLIRRGKHPSDPVQKIVNAEEFLQNLQSYLADYCEQLRSSDWDSPIWRNLRVKMDAVILNCERKR